MASTLVNNLKKLYSVVPGFRHDKDEDWIHYLDNNEQTLVRKYREQFIIKKDRLDEYKLELRDHQPRTPESIEVDRKILRQTNEINILISSQILEPLKQFKKKAEDARSRLIENDFGPGQSSEPVFGAEFAAMASSFDLFLPSHVLPAPAPEPMEEPEEEPEPEPAVAPASSHTEDRREPVRDTYLDGVAEENIELMNKMRPLVDKFDCKQRVLDALERFRKRDERQDLLRMIKSRSQANSVAVVPMDTSNRS